MDAGAVPGQADAAATLLEPVLPVVPELLGLPELPELFEPLDLSEPLDFSEPDEEPAESPDFGSAFAAVDDLASARLSLR